MSTSTLPFAPNERVLCYHGPLIYEAKVLKAESWDDSNTKVAGAVGPHFFVHYKGWKQTWDEWVPSSRLLKYNEPNLQMQKQIHQTNAAATASTSSTAKSHHKAGATGAKDGAVSSSAAGGSSRKEGSRGKKRGREEDDSSRKPEMKLTIPDVLKIQLVDDWEAVTKNGQVVSLPRTPNVHDLLDEFQQYVKSLPKPPPRPDKLLQTIIPGLRLYFDRSIGTNLLYRFERPQYAEQRKKYVTGPKVIIGQEKEMSSVYGAEHLLRMIVNMPAMVASSTMDPESVAILKEYLQELMNFMVQEKDRIFLAEYDSASAQYHNLSRS